MSCNHLFSLADAVCAHCGLTAAEATEALIASYEPQGTDRREAESAPAPVLTLEQISAEAWHRLIWTSGESEPASMPAVKIGSTLRIRMPRDYTVKDANPLLTAQEPHKSGYTGNVPVAAPTLAEITEAAVRAMEAAEARRVSMDLNDWARIFGGGMAPQPPAADPVVDARKALRIKAGLDAPTKLTEEDSVALWRALRR